MTVTYTWSGLSYQDCASLTLNGVHYRLYTYLNMDNESIEGVLYVEQENGQDVLVHRETIYQASSLGSDRLKPRCCATDSRFVVVWVLNGDLYKTSVDPSNNSWSFQGQSTMGVGATSDLFDLHSLQDGDSHVVVYVNGANTLNIRRYDDYTWIHTWGATLAENPINCLGCYGDATDNYIFAAYQINDGDGRQRMRLTHYNATTGAPQGTVYAFSVDPLEDVDWARVGICRVSSSFIALVAEGLPVEDPAANFSDRLVAFKSFVQNGLSDNGNEHYAWNLNMQSRPWGYAAEAGSANEVYCVLGYKDTFTSGHAKWAQHFAYVCCMDYRNWGEDDFTVRPYSASNMTLNTIDSRPGRLTNTVDFHSENHLPHVSGTVPFGPNVKTATIPLIEFGRTTIRAAPDSGATRAEVIPVNATVTGFKFHHEDLWSYYRHPIDDPDDPPNNGENYLGPYPWSQFKNIEIGDSMFIGGGCPAIYDGKQVVEMGFMWAPELQIKSVTDVGGNPGLDNGNYLWTAVYEWRDNAGQLHRSAPAEPVYRSISSGSPSTSVVLRARTMTLSLKEGFRYPDASSIEIVLYRTVSNGNVFYRVHGGDGSSGWQFGTIENTPKNDPTVRYIEITDAQLNSFLTSSERLPHQYINNAWVPVANWPPPACGSFAPWNNRLWYASSEDGAQLWYSKAVLPEPGGVRYAVPEMSPYNVYRLDDGRGPVTGMQAMDHGLVVFKRESIFIITGEPNNDAGSGSTLVHQTVAVGTGCVDQRSIVLTPEGVFFQSEKGYYLIDRSQTLSYIGADVEDLFRTCGNVHSAVMPPNRHQIRIVMNERVTGVLASDGETAGGVYVLIYDFLMKAWSRIDLVQGGQDAWRSTAVAGCVWRGLEGENLHVVLQQGGLLIEQDRDVADSFNDESYSDSTILVPMDIRTGWIRDGLSRSSRVREIVIEADKPQASRVHVDVDYEVEGTWDSTLTDTFEWASPAPTTMRVRPRIQKLTAFRVRVYEPLGTGEVPITENIKIQSISYLVGHRGKMRKIPDSKVGT